MERKYIYYDIFREEGGGRREEGGGRREEGGYQKNVMSHAF